MNAPKRYSHAYTIAFEVDSDRARGGSEKEWLAGLMARVASFLSNPAELRGAYEADGPYDSTDRREGEDEDEAPGV
jgi:hypothetical protein